MKIFIQSNFVVPGLEGRESLELEEAEMTLREVLERLSKMSPDQLRYVEPDAQTIDPDHWEVEVNGAPYESYEEGLDHPIKDGDTVNIKIVAMGGG